MFERWRMIAILVSLLLLAELACVGTLRAQLSEDEVDFEYMAKITVEKGNKQALWNLAMEHYKNPLEWTYIKEMNKIPNEKTIPIGTIIYIPVKDAKKIVKKADDEIEKMNATEKALRDEIAKLKAQLKRAEADGKKCEAERKKLARSLRNCEAKVKKLTKALDECEASVKKKDATIAELQDMLENVKGAG
jgi:predicted RNase H-like nuclease (RuvC/YqgF family)